MSNIKVSVNVLFECTQEQFMNPEFQETLGKLKDGTFQRELSNSTLDFENVTVNTEVEGYED